MFFNPTADLPEGVPVYLTITPFNADGNAVGCSYFKFNVEVNATIPSCPVSYSIANGATNVSVNSSISWPAISSQTTYRIKIGTTLGGSDFVNNFFLNNISFYSSSFGPGPFAYSTTYYVTITTENQNSSNQTACAGFQFTTQAALASVPSCTTLVSPSSGSTNVAINSNIAWNAVANATGYSISVVDSSGTNFIQTTLGNVLTYNPTTDFAQNTTYSVTITPLNNIGSAVGCASQSFTTQTIVTIPNCTTLVSPSSGSTDVAINSDISWNAVSNATGYFISYGTNNAANNIENRVDVGNTLSYNPPNDFPTESQIYVLIIPYNTVDAIGCNLQYFDTKTSFIEIPKDVFIVPSFFTPNGDGFNDIRKIEDPQNEVIVIYIYDRFGKLFKSIPSSGNWNGTIANQNVLADDYWFVIEKKTGELIKGYFTLKR